MTVAMVSMAPAAFSEWPIWDFSEEVGGGALAKTLLRAADSVRSCWRGCRCHGR